MTALSTESVNKDMKKEGVQNIVRCEKVTIDSDKCQFQVKKVFPASHQCPSDNAGNFSHPYKFFNFTKCTVANGFLRGA